MLNCEWRQSAALAIAILVSAVCAFGQSPNIPPVISPPAEITCPEISIHHLSNGLQYVVIPRTGVPIVTLYAVIEAGAESDPPALPGTAEMVADLLPEGTAHRSAREIAEAIDQTGGSIDSGAGWDESYVNISVLAPYKQLAFDLLSATLLRPAFAPQEIERARKQTLSGLQVAMQDPGYIAEVALRQALFERTGYGHSEDGTPEAIRHIARSDLATFYHRYYVPSRAILAIAGDISEQESESLVTQYFGSWRNNGGSHGQRSSDGGIFPANPSPVEHLPAGRQIIVIDKPDSVQTEIRAGYPGITRSSPDYDALAIANQILGGPAANRLFEALRTRRGLTYGASSALDCYRSTGAWVAKTSTRSSETIQALRIFVGQIDRLRNAGPAEYEVDAARNYLIGHQALELESTAQIADRELTLMLDQLPPDYWNRLPEKLKHVSRYRVAEAAHQYLDPAKAVIVLAGNASVFRKQLAEFGPVRVIPIAQVE